MKEVTIDRVRARIAHIESLNARGVGTKVEQQQFELACLRNLLELLALRERAEPVAEVCEGFNLRYIGHGPAPKSGLRIGAKLYTAPPAPVVPEGLRIALSNAGIAAPESDELLWASQQDYIQALVTWVKDRKPFKPAPVVPDDYFASLVTAARARAEKAMRKFPQPNYVLNKVAEESGEVIKAVIHYTEGRETWQNVETEMIDNLAMLIRLVAEGDGVIGFTPPDACRAAIVAPGKEG